MHEALIRRVCAKDVILVCVGDCSLQLQRKEVVTYIVSIRCDDVCDASLARLQPPAANKM